MILDQTDKNAKALLDKHPTCEFVVGDTYESLRWKSEDITKPTEEGAYETGYMMNYSALTAVLTKAIQEQQVIIDDLKSRIETLEG